MGSISKIAGESGCDLVSGAVTYTPSGRHAGKKITAIGIHAAVNITNFKYTPNGSDGRPLAQVTVTEDNWIGSAISPSGATNYIPLGVDADEITLASGEVMVYLK